MDDETHKNNLGDNCAVPAVPGTPESGSMEYSQADKTSEDSASLSGIETRAIKPSGDIFYVSQDVENDTHPTTAEVAFEYNYLSGTVLHYMVVYEEHGNIFGTIISAESGEITARVQISAGIPYDGRSYDPEVSYEFRTDQFVVVWEYDFAGDGSDYDIHAATVDPETGDTSPIIGVQETDTNETDPDIACTLNTNQCLVVVDYDNGSGLHSIRGQHIIIKPNLEASGFDGSAFQINTATNCRAPHIATSDYGGGYLVAYTGHYYEPLLTGYFTHVHDRYQEYTPQWKHFSTFWRNHPTDPGYQVYYPTSVTFNPCSWRYIIAYNLDFSGSAGEDWDVMAIAVDHETQDFLNIPVAASMAQELNADVSFLWPYVMDQEAGPYIDYFNCEDKDQVVIAYERWLSPGSSQGVLVTEIIGNGDWESPGYNVPYTSDHVLVAEPLSKGEDYQPAIAGGSGIGEFLVIIPRYDLSSGKRLYDVIGRFMTTAMQSYVPFINH
jgi:hypothetical protein